MQSTVAWNNLSALERTAFNEYALVNTFTSRYGVSKVLTGFQWYKNLSQASNYFTGSQLLSPPPFELPEPLPTFTVIKDGNFMVMQWDEPIDLSAVSVYFYATNATRSLAPVQRGSFRQLDLRDVDYSNAFDITPYWNQAFSSFFEYLAIASKCNIAFMVFAVNNESFNTGVKQSFVLSI